MSDPIAAQSRTNILCYVNLGLGIIIGIAALFQTYLFNLISVYLTARLKFV